MDQESLQVVKKTQYDNAIYQEKVNTEAGAEYTFVASKRGKYYYPIVCNRAKTLSIQNMLYFKDKMSAEAAGFIPFSGC